MGELDDVLLLVLIVAGAFYAGWKAHEYFTILAIQASPEIFEDACRAARAEAAAYDEDGELVEMDTETHNGVVYAYDKDTGRFLSQGNNVYQAAVSAAKRFPGTRFTHPELEEDDEEDQKA